MLASRPDIALAALLIALGGGCATTPSPHGASHPQLAACAKTSSVVSMGMRPTRLGLPSRVVDAKTRAELDGPALEARLRAARVVYVAEAHPNPHHHAVQAAIVDRATRAGLSPSVGLEMIQRPFQAPLDAWRANQRTEDELLAGVEWADRWGFEFGLYRWVFDHARVRGLPLVALNAPRELTRKIARQGLAALTPEEKATLPELVLTDEAHRAFVRRAFEGHTTGEHAMPPEAFERFYAAQVTWDETMASAIAEHLTARGPDARMIVLAGLGHVARGLGIPARAARRGVGAQLTIVPVVLGDDVGSLDEALTEPLGDLLWVMDPARCAPEAR
jgi:uncharacterized iron-regulated protein